MAFMSGFTPYFIAVFCVLIVCFWIQSQREKKTKESKGEADSTSKAKPWVDQDLQDDTEIPSPNHGRLSGYPDIQIAYRKFACNL